MQQKLFEEKVKSYGHDQAEILKNILKLHIPRGRFHVDASYGYGVFYKQVQRPELCFDLEPKRKNVVKADSRILPLDNNSIDSIVFDPPFVITDHKNSEHYLMHKRYSGFKLISDLREMYSQSIKEFCRVLKPGGQLVFKCHDTTHGKKNYCIHNEVMNMADCSGFIFLDIFILLNDNVFQGSMKEQRTARKHHSYFLVFKKRSRNSRSGNKL